MRRIRTILVGASLEESGDLVLRAAVSLARQAGARLHLIHSFQLPMTEEPLAADWGMAQYLRDETRALERRLEAQLDRLGIADQEISGKSIEVGAPHRLLVGTAHEIGADFIVVGAQESTGPFARWLGSTADRVIRKAACPIFVVREANPEPPQRVLLPLDLSPLSADALGYAVDLLAGLGGERLPAVEAVMVLSGNMSRELAMRHQADPSQVPAIAERDLRAFLAAHATSDLEVGPRLRFGEVTEGILAEIEQWRPDLVIMGTHGRGGFERFLIGSIAAAVLRHASCNLIIVPPEAALKAALARERPDEGETR